MISLGILVLVAALLGSGLFAAVASPLQETAQQPPPLYTIWGTIADSATGAAPEGARVRVYNKDPQTLEFWGIDGPDGMFIYPDETGRWSVTHDAAIEWLVVKLFYDPGWVSVTVEGPLRSYGDEERIELQYPEPGEVGPFSYTLVLATDTPTPGPPTVAPPTVMPPTQVPPTATVPAPTIPVPMETELYCPLIYKQ